MSNTLLSSEDFGLKIYERFPPTYKEADEHYNLALKRYLQALGDGGFKYSIEEINGLLDLVDPDRVGADVLPFLYSQYGLELFNGIPENYLRYFLPFLSLAYSKKGSLGVIPFITTSLSGIKTSTDIVLDTYGNPKLNVSLEMDYQVGNNFFPKSEQFKRILENFLPFYVDCTIVYLYNLFDGINLSGIDDDFIDNLLISNEEQNFIGVESLITTDDIVENAFNDIVGLFDTKSDNQCCWILNDTNSLLNTGTLINLDMVDKITSSSGAKIAIPTYSRYILL